MKKRSWRDVTQEEWDSMYQNQLELELQPLSALSDNKQPRCITTQNLNLLIDEYECESSIDEIPKKTLH
jgi:hypothetical protein